MTAYIVEFPNEWFLRVGRSFTMPIATGDRGKATRFHSAIEARQALAAATTIKPKIKKTARIVQLWLED